LEIEQNLFRRAMMSPAKYAEPLAQEIESKLVGSKRRLAIDLYGDGTGVVGTIASAAVTSPASNQIVFTLSSSATARGAAAHFEYDDLLVLKANGGGASALDTSLATEPVYWKVVDKNREANTVTLQGLDSGLAAVASITSISVQPTAGDVFYRYGQPSIPNLASIADYGTASEVIPGLLALASNDGRLVHGITMSGASAASIQDVSGDPLDVSQVRKMLDNMKIRVGQNAYSYKKLVGAPEAHAAFIESRETDRRFTSVTDDKRGLKQFGYIHGNDTLVVVESEFCPMKQMYALPEAKGGDKVLEFHGTDFQTVRAKDGDEWHLKPSSAGGHERVLVSYMDMYGTLICKRPAAIGRLQNFSL
jgi:hypothetical protein